MPEQNNKLKLVRAVMLCVTLAIMAAIFLFSAQPGESSSALSQQITEKVESTAAHRLTPKWFSSQNDNANIRKWAHVYIYCALRRCQHRRHRPSVWQRRQSGRGQTACARSTDQRCDLYRLCGH